MSGYEETNRYEEYLGDKILELERENKRLNKIISDIKDWGIVISDEGLLKLIKALKAGECRSRPTGG